MALKINAGNETIEADGSAANIDIAMVPKGTGNVILSGLKYPNGDGGANQVIETDGAGNLSFVAQSGGGVVQTLYTEFTALDSTTTTITLADTIPTNTEGKEILTLAITPQNVNNILHIEALGYLSNTVSKVRATMILYQDAIVNALSVGMHAVNGSTGNLISVVPMFHRMTAGTTSATTFKIRYGGNQGTTYLNGEANTRRYGGVLRSWLRITEYQA